MAPTPPTFGAPRQSRGAPLILVGAPTWPPHPPTFGAPRRSRGAPLILVGAPTWPPHPQPSERPGKAVALLSIARCPRDDPSSSIPAGRCSRGDRPPRPPSHG